MTNLLQNLGAFISFEPCKVLPVSSGFLCEGLLYSREDSSIFLCATVNTSTTSSPHECAVLLGVY